MKELGIPVHIWTVNDESWMEWSVRNGLSGVITDEVALFHEVCDRIGNGKGQIQSTNKSQRKTAGLSSLLIYRTVRSWGEMALIHFLIGIFMARDWLKHGSPSHQISKTLSS
jgi:phosphatidylglycerol phospholipase C